jgi:hypothetical protein
MMNLFLTFFLPSFLIHLRGLVQGNQLNISLNPTPIRGVDTDTKDGIFSVVTDSDCEVNRGKVSPTLNHANPTLFCHSL